MLYFHILLPRCVVTCHPAVPNFLIIKDFSQRENLINQIIAWLLVLWSWKWLEGSISPFHSNECGLRKARFLSKVEMILLNLSCSKKAIFFVVRYIPNVSSCCHEMSFFWYFDHFLRYKMCTLCLLFSVSTKLLFVNSSAIDITVDFAKISGSL